MKQSIPWRQKANIEWELWMDNEGRPDMQTLLAILLLDVREELQQLNHVFRYPNFQSISKELRGLRRDLKTKKTPGRHADG